MFAGEFLQCVEWFVGRPRFRRDCHQIDGPIGSSDTEYPVVKLDIGFRRLEHAGRDPLAFRLNVLARHVDSRARHEGGARATVPAAFWN